MPADLSCHSIQESIDLFVPDSQGIFLELSVLSFFLFNDPFHWGIENLIFVLVNFVIDDWFRLVCNRFRMFMSISSVKLLFLTILNCLLSSCPDCILFLFHLLLSGNYFCCIWCGIATLLTHISSIIISNNTMKQSIIRCKLSQKK